MKRHYFSKDQHGYISARRNAKSKYWGVTTASSSAFKPCWIVSLTDPQTFRTKSFHARDFWISETDAARVAAMLYDAGDDLRAVNRKLVRSTCGRYALRVNTASNTITRYPATVDMTFVNDVVPTVPAKEITLPFAEPVVQVEPVAPTAVEVLTRLIDLVTLTDEERLVLIHKLSK